MAGYRRRPRRKATKKLLESTQAFLSVLFLCRHSSMEMFYRAVMPRGTLARDCDDCSFARTYSRKIAEPGDCRRARRRLRRDDSTFHLLSTARSSRRCRIWDIYVLWRNGP